MKKRILATALCASMLLSSAVVGAADPLTTETGTGNDTGTGKVEGILDKEVFSVTLPTTATKTYDFILDPQDLITATNNGAYTDTTFTGDTGMYFKTADKSYTEKSAPSTVTNKSSVDIDVTMDVKVDMNSMEGISIENAADLKETTPSINLALVGSIDGGQDDTAYVGTDGTLSKTIKLGSDVDDYTAVYEDSAYKYKNNGSSHEDSKYVFSLTGAVNKKATGWAEVKDKTPKITVTWTYGKHVEGPQVAVSKNDTNKTISVAISGLTAEKAFNSMKMSDGTNEFAYDAVAGAFTKTGNDESEINIALSNAWYNGFAGKTVTFTVTLKDNSIVTGTISIPAA